MEQVIAHVDMDCFFAACEEKMDPSLKGKPVAIGALPSYKRGVLSTANYEARKYGLRSAMPISQAVKLCPDAVYLPVNFALYRNESAKVMHILKQFATAFEQMSIDEAYMDITAFVRRFPNLEEAGRYMQDSVKEATGLNCSIGISNSRYVSKIASDFKKPFGITVVEDAKNFLAELPIGKISGVGKKTAARLNEIGIFKIKELADCDRFKLIDNFGNWVIGFQEIARGNDETGVFEDYGPRKSISREMTFQDDIGIDECYDWLEKVVERLDLEDYSFKTVSLKLRFSNFETITRDMSLKIAVNSRSVALDKVRKILAGINSEDKVRLIGVRLSNLIYEENKQLPITDFCEA
ncbi:DNA polymerase IV [Candidatus Woesearchaeota archaeon]|nr:DNA polymerase IV [Candidatus Woesearchaeota archaeon]